MILDKKDFCLKENILWDKTPPVANAERVESFYLLEKRSVEVYNVFPIWVDGVYKSHIWFVWFSIYFDQ